MAKWRVLVVDDERDIRDLVRSSLEPEYEVVDARDGLDALEKLERVEPDFIILDVMMPLLDGIQTCVGIRRHPRYSKATVLFLSALAGQGDIRRGYEAGANLYLTKPFDPARLRRNVDVFFEKSSQGAPPARRYTLEQLEQLEAGGADALAQAELARHSRHPEPAPAPQTQTATAPTTMRPRILVVDDESEICTLAGSALRHAFEVFCAADGIDAIGKITTYQPDLLLIDTMMPRMSGYQLCQSLRQNARFAKTPIILASAKQSEKDREYSLRIGANYFMQKPYTGIEVLHAAQAMVALPHFRVHPKALSEKAIHDLENSSPVVHAQKVHERVHPEDVKQLKEFVRRHADP